MDRRGFVRTVAGAPLLMPVAGRAQQAAKRFRVIGWLHHGGAFGSSLDAVRLRLAELGWIEGRNIAIVTRSAYHNPEALPALAAELVGLEVAVIVTPSISATLAARKATTRIPIVMAGAGSDSSLVELGLISSLARPGGNVTGLTNNPGSGFFQKIIQVLKDAAPRVTRVAVLWNPGGVGELREIQAAAPALGLTVVDAEARAPEEVPVALAAAVRAGADGLYASSGSINYSRRKTIVDFARADRLPSIAPDRDFVAAGGLLSYWTDWTELRRQCASYVDKILRGADPAELAVEQPSKFELVINLKTAAAIGITIPQAVLVRANEVIR